MYLHRDRETFKDMIEQTSASCGQTPAVVEKDYYVTLILKLLSEQLDQCVIDKVFALCDYYLQGKSKRYSRHLYDVYKLTPLLEFNDVFVELIREVREHRSKMRICPSADAAVDVPAIIQEFCDNSFYKEDYRSVTSYFAADAIPYDDVIGQMRALAASNLFAR